MPSSSKTIATAILAVYNAEATIKNCLNSLLAQSVPLEIIIVDDGSTDSTKSLMVRTIKLYPKATIKILDQNHAGPALARNLGAKHSTSPILLFVDADMSFDRDYVRDLIRPLLITHDSLHPIGTYTIEERVGNWDNLWARCWNLQEGWEDKKRFPPNPPQYGTDFRAILKSKFEAVAGFDNIGYTDTWSLFHKLNTRPLATRAICYHKNPDTLAAVFRQAKWSAKRPYKYGLLGALYTLLRASLPVSIVIGFLKSLTHLNPAFFLFKIIYDLGRFLGITQYLLTGDLRK